MTQTQKTHYKYDHKKRVANYVYFDRLSKMINISLTNK